MVIMSGYFNNNDVDMRNVTNVLQQMSNAELEAILNDTNNVRADSLIMELPQVKALEAEREKLIQNNKRLAESNLSFESTYSYSRQNLTESLQECQTLKDELDRKKSLLRQFGRQNSLDTTLALMQAATAEAEEASEEVANRFLRKDMPIEDFLKEFMEKRKLYHSRRIKTEKMPAEISKVNSTIIQPVRQAPPPPILPFSSQFSGMNVSQNANPPYPTGNPFANFITQPPNNNPYNF